MKFNLKEVPVVENPINTISTEMFTIRRPTSGNDRLAYVRQLMIEVSRECNTACFVTENGHINSHYTVLNDNGEWIQIVSQETTLHLER